MLRRLAAQEAHAQERHAGAVAARLVAAPGLAQRHQFHVGRAQVVERMGANGGADGGPAQLGIAHVAASNHHADEGQAVEFLHGVVKREHGVALALGVFDAGVLEQVEDGGASHRLADQRQQRQDHFFIEFQRVEFVLQGGIGHSQLGKLSM